ncbi:MAG: tyrosine-type recombinase/integrase [Candidatus Gastranaerophilales bacterium]|nr:tyrosine-type recombinase/integrase [Candidatus Gastranaerophilales bacterium]
MLALTKEDFNYKEENIRINKQYTNRELKAKTKTESSNRKIYLFEELNETLNEHIKTLKSDNKLLFPNTSGGYINANNLRRRFFYPLLKRSGIIKRVRLHDLRGSYIDMVLSSGLSIKFAQEQAGHSRSETTLNTYAKNSSDMIKTAEEKINFIFKNVRKM